MRRTYVGIGELIGVNTQLFYLMKQSQCLLTMTMSSIRYNYDIHLKDNMLYHLVEHLAFIYKSSYFGI